MKAPSRPTLNDVASHANVSRGTVSNVFSHPERVRTEVRERVEAAAREIGYGGPDPRGRLLRAGKFNAIGFVVPGAYGFVNLMESPYGRDLVLGISEACDEAGVSLTLIDGRPGQMESAVTNALVDGLIVGNSGDLTLIERARQRRLPVVVIDIGAGPDIASVGINAFEGARLAAEHLVGLGHRCFAIVSVKRNQGQMIVHPPGRDRRLTDGAELDREKIRGYTAGLTKGGIDIDDVPIIEAVPWEADIAGAVLAAAPDITAILLMADRQAVTMLLNLQQRAIAVPERLSILGFDGIAEGAATLPPLTTIEQPTREKGKRAAELLLEGAPPQQTTLPVKLIVRASTGPARTQFAPNA